VGETGASYERIEFIIKEDNSSFITISEDSHGELFQIISEIKAEEILSLSLSSIILLKSLLII